MRQKHYNFISGNESQTWLQLSRKKISCHLLMAINKQNNIHKTPPQNHITFIMSRPKGIGSRHTRDNVFLLPRTVNKIEISCHHGWYLCLLHWMIQSLINLSCPWFVNSYPAFSRKHRQIHKLLRYLFGIQLICQILCQRRQPIIEVAIFMNAWLMCLSWHRNNDKIMS